MTQSTERPLAPWGAVGRPACCTGPNRMYPRRRSRRRTRGPGGVTSGVGRHQRPASLNGSRPGPDRQLDGEDSVGAEAPGPVERPRPAGNSSGRSTLGHLLPPGPPQDKGEYPHRSRRDPALSNLPKGDERLVSPAAGETGPRSALPRHAGGTRESKAQAGTVPRPDGLVCKPCRPRLMWRSSRSNRPFLVAVTADHTLGHAARRKAGPGPAL